MTHALSMPGELAWFLRDLGLAVPGEPPAQAGVLLRARQSLTEIVRPGNIPALPTSSTQIVREFIGLAVAAPDGRTAEETAGQMVLDLSERNLHLNGSLAEMSGQTVPAGDSASVSGKLGAEAAGRLLTVTNLPRLSQLPDDVLGVTPTRYTMAGDAPYVPGQITMLRFAACLP